MTKHQDKREHLPPRETLDDYVGKILKMMPTSTLTYRETWALKQYVEQLQTINRSHIMSTSVHAHFEIKVDDEWLHYSQPRVEQNYALFEKMAGVRGSIENAIAPPRDLPDDISKTTQLDAQWWSGDGHSHSWLSSTEFKELHDFHVDNTYTGEAWEIDHKQWFYLFGNNWASFHKYPENYPKEVQDFRLVFWFDC